MAEWYRFKFATTACSGAKPVRCRRKPNCSTASLPVWVRIFRHNNAEWNGRKQRKRRFLKSGLLSAAVISGIKKNERLLSPALSSRGGEGAHLAASMMRERLLQ